MNKLVFLHDSFDYYGGGEQMLVRTAELMRGKAEISLGLLWGTGRAITKEMANSFKSIRQFDFPEAVRPNTLPGHRRATRELSQFILNEAASGVVSFSLRPAVRMAGTSAAREIPTAWMCQQSFPLFEPPLPMIKQTLGINALQKSETRIVCISEEQRRGFIQLGFAPQKLELIRNGIDVQRFAGARATLSDKRRHRADAGFSPGRFTLVCVARLDPIKNHMGLLAGLKHAVRSGLDIELICVGEEPGEQQDYTRHLREQSHQFQLGDRVHWIGARNDIRPFLRMADALVLPSVKEAAPLVLAEAGAAGLPLIGSNVGGIPEAIRHGANGFLMDPTSPETFTRAVAPLVHDERRRENIGRCAHDLVNKEFNMTKQNKKWRAFLESLCQPENSDLLVAGEA